MEKQKMVRPLCVKNCIKFRVWKKRQATMIHFPFTSNSDPFWQEKNLTSSLKMLSTKPQLSIGWTLKFKAINKTLSSQNPSFFYTTHLKIWRPLLRRFCSSISALASSFSGSVAGWWITQLIMDLLLVWINSVSSSFCCSSFNYGVDVSFSGNFVQVFHFQVLSLKFLYIFLQFSSKLGTLQLGSSLFLLWLLLLLLTILKSLHFFSMAFQEITSFPGIS